MMTGFGDSDDIIVIVVHNNNNNNTAITSKREHSVSADLRQGKSGPEPDSASIQSPDIQMTSKINGDFLV